MITAEELKSRRLSARLTQDELAVQLGVAVRSVRNWEASGVPAKREALIDAVLPADGAGLEPAAATRTRMDARISDDQDLVSGAMDALDYLHHAFERGATRSTVERGMAAVVNSLRETGGLDVLDRQTRRTIIELMTFELGDVALAASDPSREEGPDGEDLETER